MTHLTTPQKTFAPERDPQAVDSSLKSLWNLAGIAALTLLVYSLVTMLSLIVLGGQPATAQEAFAMLQNNRLVGLLRLDLLSILVLPLYYLLFLGLYTVLKPTNAAFAALAAVLAFAGVTLFLATPSVFSWLSLSDKFAAAVSDVQRTQWLAAGEAILATDMWHGSGALMGGLLLQAGAVMISVVMLRNKAFTKSTAYLGIAMHSLDLAHILVGFFLPVGGVILLAIAGPLYLVWFPLLARDFFRLAKQSSIG